MADHRHFLGPEKGGETSCMVKAPASVLTNSKSRSRFLIYNAEHYADPTAYRALRNIEREQQMKRPHVDVTDRKKVRTQVIRYD